MKEQLKHQFWWLSSSVMVILASLNLGTEARAQLLHYADIVLLSEKNNNSLTTTISANELFRSAYENRYTLAPQFPGYTAAVELKQGKGDYKGKIRVNSDLSVQVTGIDDKDARQTVENQLSFFITHHRRVPFEVEHKNSTFQLGATDPTGAVEIFEHGVDKQGDKTEAHYKVFRQQLKQVNRLLGKTAVTVDVLNSEVTPEGYLATRYRAIFRQPQSKQVLGEEESEDTYRKIGVYYILSRQVIHDFEQGQKTTTELNFTDIQLL